MRSACVVAILLGAASSSAHADEPEPDAAAEPALSLRRVVDVAVREAPELARARYDAAAARGEAQRAEGALDLRVIGSARREEFKDAANILASVDDETSTTTFSLGFEKSFFLGTRIAVTGEASEVEAGGNEAKTKRLLFTFSQPLLRGAGPGAAEGAIDQARHTADAAQLAREAAARTLLVNLTRAYWDVALAARELEVRRAGVATAQKQLRYTEGAIRSDKVPRSEAVAVEQAIAIRDLDLIAAEQRLLDRSLALRTLAGLEIDAAHLAVVTDPLPGIGAEPVGLDKAVAAALAKSAEIASLEAAQRAAASGLDAANGAARPRLDFDVTGGPINSKATDVMGVAVEGEGYSVNASLTFESSIMRNTERGGRDVARAALSRAKIDVRAAKARVAGEAMRAVQRVRSAMAAGKIAERAVALAQQNVENEQRRFELGKTTNFEVVRRFDELELARLRQAEVIVSYLTARAELAGLTGELLGTYGLKVD